VTPSGGPQGSARRECEFCAIADGTAEAHLVYEDERALAFLDHRPLFPGHTLVIPRAHVETLPDLPVEELGPFFRATQLVAHAMPPALEAEGTFVANNNLVSQSVPHLHVHVVPRSRGDGLRGFFWPRHPYDSPEQMREVQARLREAIEGLAEG
jgi:histidine triad (HIT) family protein